jgi:hypothetical protein
MSKKNSGIAQSIYWATGWTIGIQLPGKARHFSLLHSV